MRRYNIRYIVDELTGEVRYCRGRMRKDPGMHYVTYLASTDGVHWKWRSHVPGNETIYKRKVDLITLRLRGKQLIMPDDWTW